MYNGIINVYKEAGFTSHDVVAKLRGITHQKKIGHTGTLDPDAEGVLCICLGAATRICGMLTDAVKEYEAVMLLGVTTDTQDTSGNVLSAKDVNVDEDAVRECIEGFTGEISQIPPMYSAIKINGKKLYELARAGVEVERSPRKITIYNIDIVDITLPEVTMRVTCSKGTYIRTLCSDIGEKLGCGGTMKHLLRTAVGDFKVSSSVRLSEIENRMNEGRIEELIVPPMEVFSGLKHFTVSGPGEKKASNGNVLDLKDISLHNTNTGLCDGESSLHNIDLNDSEEVVITDDNGFFYGIFGYNASGQQFRPIRMFMC